MKGSVEVQNLANMIPIDNLPILQLLSIDSEEIQYGKKAIEAHLKSIGNRWRKTWGILRSIILNVCPM